MQVELPDVREAIITQDAVDKPALIVIDGAGIGKGVYQDLLEARIEARRYRVRRRTVQCG